MKNLRTKEDGIPALFLFDLKEGADVDLCEAHTQCMERLVAVEASVKSAHHRIDEVQESQKILMEMNTNIRLLVEQNKVQDQKLENVEKDVKELKEKPNKRWETVVAAVITALCSGIAGAALTLLFR